MKINYILTICSMLYATFALGTPPQKRATISEDLAAFHRDTVTFMNRTPEKYDSSGQLRYDSPFPPYFDTADMLNARNELRNDIMNAANAGLQDPTPLNHMNTWAGYQDDDQAQRLVDNAFEMLVTLEAMESKQLRSATIPERPWSGDYWPIYQGTLGARYDDSMFPGSIDWKTNYDYIQSHPAFEILMSGDQQAINKLSPSEKYDALVGDTEHQLTKKMWQQGEYYYNEDGRVEAWFGICHGWAPASYAMTRPQKPVTLLSHYNNVPITFYPHDLKALASLLWAEVGPTTRFIGSRCNEGEPEESEYGRILDQQCFDNNPATWHLSVVNQVGLSQRSFVLDAAYDREVWNQPVVGYHYQYFNPETGEDTENLADARIPIAAYTLDKFTEFRDERTHYVVGIAMDLTYMVETRARTQTHDDASQDAQRTVRYYYDLELDEHGRIIGGEWYSNRHPDFLWTHEPEGRALTFADVQLQGDWDVNEKVPLSWLQKIQDESHRGRPIAKIVEPLFRLAQ